MFWMQKIIIFIFCVFKHTQGITNISREVYIAMLKNIEMGRLTYVSVSRDTFG